MLSILAYVAATIGAAYCMKPLTNLLESSGAAPNETYAKYISLILGLAGLYLLAALQGEEKALEVGRSIQMKL